MPGVPRGGRDELVRFRRLLDIAILSTFALIIIGGVVRVSDSGLGCGPAGSGTEGWPLCDGQVLPFLEGSTLVEFSHRVVAGLVAILIAVIAWTAWRRLRERRWLVWGSVGAGVLVLAQAGLGGLTVEHNLEEALVAAHLGLAMLLLAILLALRRATSEGARAAPAPGSSRGLRALAAVAAGLVLATIVAGGYMAGTEREGVAGAGSVQGAHMACGDQFPTCAGELAPFGTSRLIDIHLAHRTFMALAVVVVVALVLVAWRRGVRSRSLTLALGLLAAQVLLGALNVWLGEHAGLIVAHLTLGTLLWASVVSAGLELVRVPAPSGERQPQAGRPGEAPATV
jgi:heme A synthase